MGTKRKLSEIDSIVIHCADTPNGRHFTVKQVDQWHGERNPPFMRDMSIAPNHQPELKHIGYHYVVEINGETKEGRPLMETGAHVAGFNQTSIGICLIGRDQFSQAQWWALLALIQNIERELNKELKLYGHNEYNPHKQCPGFYVPDWVKRKFRPLDNQVIEEEG